MSKFGQEQIVFLIFCVIFIVFSLLLPNFLATENLLNLVRSVAVLGVLGIGMVIVVVGRGIDLSIIANMAISVAFALQLTQDGMPFGYALLLGLSFAVFFGTLTGFLVAYVEVPALFATLAMGIFIYGIGRFQLISLDVVYAPKSVEWFQFLGKGRVLGLPMPIILLAALSAIVFWCMKYLKIGRVMYLIGDNLNAARITGIAVRPTIIVQYIMSAMIAFGAGLIVASSVNSMNTRVMNSTQIYDVILVVVLGGVGLSGGKGGVRNVLVGTLLIGTLLNGMTILDVPYTVQNVAKGLILLGAIVIDGLLNPRDEQTAQQGDI